MAPEWCWNDPETNMDGEYEIVVNYDSGGTAPDRRPPEFDRFEDLSRKLMDVPKREVDDKHEKS